jgi:putative transposase
LIKRGLRGVKFIASDDHAGLKAARKAMFAGVPWQRCQFHLQHNAQGYVSKLDQRVPVARTIRAIFNAPDANEATRLLGLALGGVAGEHPNWLLGLKIICLRALRCSTCRQSTACECARPMVWSG